ncbi:hypothetical protein SODALDRAFT_270650 [Sodiomyces alkalinus F11]|uniref:Uncharacterized protein n=1 Tax=Sodiomyces alkalinus (strain CBS 110278 / VKM F-3762 / F11) TaxID=1314773 RepID=A0A3N2Q2L1_SODAK|nr:hypothetical protein SODALDRAFT_270650 [Sodiomyces alkalinus F11]ROT40990.1 hypothetical protein SODALDRAFT_270650 [Sodiomyces alkalinus F11]
MSYYENNAQWSSPTPGQNNWDHQTPVRGDVARTLTARPTEVDRAYETLAKSGKSFGLPPRREYSSPGPRMGPGPGPGRKSLDYNGRMPVGPGSRPHSINQFEDPRAHPNANLQNFYASQRHQPSRGSSEAEQMMQAKRRMAAQRERELRNLHTEQQYQRTVLSDMNYGNKHMSEEETRELIARQRSALYGEGLFAEKGGYVDETGIVRTGSLARSGPSSLRGASPMAFEGSGPFRSGLPPPNDAANLRNQSPMNQDHRGGPAPAHQDANASVSGPETVTGSMPGSGMEQGSRTGSTSSPQPNAANKTAFESAVSQAAARTSSSSSPSGSPPRQDVPAGSKAPQHNATVAPIGTRPSGTPGAASSGASKRSTTPLASPGGWGRGNDVWGPQASGLSSATSASVWG